jgi:hypothetical protein
MPTDTKVNDLKINVLSEAQYEQIQSPSNTELYLVPEIIDTTPTSGSTNPITSGGVYNALQNIPSQEQSDWNETNSILPSYIKNKPTIPAAQVNADWNATSGAAEILNKPAIPTVNNATLTIKKNGTTIDTFSANSDTDKTIDISVPTNAADVSALPSSTKYAASLYLSVNSSTYVVTAQLKDQDGNNIGAAQTIDLPLESVVVSGSYNSQTKKVVLTLQNGSTIEFSVADLVAGLQSEITAQNPLRADLVKDGRNNKVFTAAEKTKLSGIEAGAEVNVQADWKQRDDTADDYIKNKPENLVSDSRYVHTDNNYTTTEKNKLSGIEVGAEVNVQSDWNQTDSSTDDFIKNKPDIPDIKIYRNLTGKAAITTSPYWCARWDVTDDSVSAYRDGMGVCIKVPVAGNGSYGTALQINELGYKPVVFGLNSMISTRYPVGSVVWAVYNINQTATLYLGNGSQTITGCWQVMDYNSDTTSITNVRRYYSARMRPTTDLLDYVLVFRKNETQVVPMHSTPNGTSGTAANTGSTRTDKEMTTESFDPFGEILFYRNGTKIAANAVIPTATLFQQINIVPANNTFNCGTTLTGSKELYLVVDLQSDGTVKLAQDPCWSQTLPTTNDGHLYIFLGVTYDSYRFELLMNHPIYYHDGTQLRMYTGAKIPTKTSELDNDSGFIAGPSASVDDNIPAFGNTSGNLAKDSGVSVRRLYEDVDVLSEMEVNPYYIAGGTGLWDGSATTHHRIISVKDIRKVTITAKTSRGARYAFLRTYTAPSDADIDTAPDYVSGYTTAKEVPAGETKSVVVPADANYLYVQQSTANYNNLPDYVKFTGIGITEHTGDGSGFIKDDGSVDTTVYQPALPSLTDNAGKVLAVNSGATNVEWRKPVVIYSGSTAPASSLGSDGDIYIMTTT